MIKIQAWLNPKAFFIYGTGFELRLYFYPNLLIKHIGISLI